MIIEILYEDTDVIVINKPAGLVVHFDGRTKEDSVVDWVREQRPETIGVGEELTLARGDVIERPGIVHRLDRETSGVLVLAKTQDSFLSLKEQFKQHTIRKKYNAFVYGRMRDERGVINKPIGRSPSDFRKWSAQRSARGNMREAETGFSRLKASSEVSFIEARPQTGRTHQIRVHMKAVGHPVVCDSLYAPKQPALLGFDRLALHAREIEFVLLSGVRKTVEAPFPNDFTKALELFS